LFRKILGWKGMDDVVRYCPDERQITANVVQPGLSDTDGLSPEFRANRALPARTPLGRLGPLEDIADVVAFAGDDARWVMLVVGREDR
jgi:NAD(P)-dependent dehydrogenase (short-subunit alcohol dehydrogenase family)